jgi:hypothetical protein
MRFIERTRTQRCNLSTNVFNVGTHTVRMARSLISLREHLEHVTKYEQRLICHDVIFIQPAEYVDPCNRSEVCNFSLNYSYNEKSPDPNNCSVYAECRVNGEWSNYPCPGGLWFDINSLNCEQQSTAICQPPCLTTILTLDATSQTSQSR